MESYFPALTAEKLYLYEREQSQGHCCESEQSECAHLNLHSSANDKVKQVGSSLLQMQAIFYYSPLHSLAL